MRSSSWIWLKASSSFLAVVADVDDAAAGVVGELFHVAGAGVGEVDAEAASAVEAAVGDEDDVDDGVGLLGGLGGGLEGLLRALIAAVGEQDEDLAAGLLAELVVGGEVDGVEEQGAAGVAVAGDGAGAGAGVDLGLVHGARELAGGVGVVGEEVDVDVEGDEEGLVLGGEDVFEELGAGLLLERAGRSSGEPEVSSRMPMVRGRFFSWVKFLIVWGSLSSRRLQSSLWRLVM